MNETAGMGQQTLSSKHSCCLGSAHPNARLYIGSLSESRWRRGWEETKVLCAYFLKENYIGGGITTYKNQGKGDTNLRATTKDLMLEEQKA